MYGIKLSNHIIGSGCRFIEFGTLFILLFFASAVHGDTGENQPKEASGVDLSFAMSLEELLSEDVTLATLTGMELSKVPAAITIISRDDIEKTPARNILDLIEVYVPGAMLFNGHNGPPRVRMRGLGIRNYTLILLVNNRPVNQKAFQGAVIELQNWDLNDIDHIEVIRGPGSVTYGPGAISGVINIITKQGGALDGFKSGVEYNEKYNSKGGFLQYGFDKEKLKIFTHISIRDTDGYKDNKVFQTLGNGEIGYKGTNVFSGRDGYPTHNYYKNYDGDPQIKAHMDLTYLEDWHFWMRYTNSGRVAWGGTKRQYLGSSDWEDSYQYQDRSFISTLENTHHFSDVVSLKSILSFDSEEYCLLGGRNQSYNNTDDRQRLYSFSENEVFFKSILNYDPGDKIKAALGFEYSYDYLSDPWGESDTFRAYAGGFYFSRDSVYNQDVDPSRVNEYINGWHANTYSLMGEFTYRFASKLEVLTSARLDKNDYTDSMFSPRIALILEMDDRNIVKAVWQKALRMNTMMELYYLDSEGLDDEPEDLTTYQVIYNRLQNENLTFQVSTYYNEVEIMSWSGTNAEIVGELDSYGVELTAKYKTDKWLFGINHSYFHLKDWDYLLKASDGSSRQDVSLSDYFYIRDYLTFSDTGNSLNSWADNITKLYARVKLLDNWTLHMDSRVVWKYEYGEDLMKMYRKAYDNADTGTLSAEDLVSFNSNYALLDKYENILDDKDAFDLSCTLNASLSWNIPYFKNHKAIMTLYCQNLLDYGDGKRYAENFYVSYLPIIGWVEEPRTFGFRLTTEF